MVSKSLLFANCKMGHLSRVVLSMFVPIVQSSRVIQQIAVQTSADKINQSASEFPDFAFMTNNFKYAGHEKNIGGQFAEWFGNRAISKDIKDEIVQGHYCANKGDRQNTYYASSFCYWFPQRSLVSQSRGLGLKWHGRSTSVDQPLCGGVAASGKCMKCSVCHNNANTKDGILQKNVFVEELRLPRCMKEQAIEERCNRLYDEQAQSLKAENLRCGAVQERYNNAVSALNECLIQLQTLPQQIEYTLPQAINQQNNKIGQLGGRLEAKKDYVWVRRREMKFKCTNYQLHSLAPNLGFMSILLLSSASASDVLSYTIFCRRPIMPANYYGNDQNRDYRAERAARRRYELENELYYSCRRCQDSQLLLRRAYNDVQRAENDLQKARGVLVNLEAKLTEAVSRLNYWQGRAPDLQLAKDTMDREWLPQSAGCQQTFNDYETGKANYLVSCAPSFYEQSCEKACIERQQGCGVIEGSPDSESLGLGGAEVVCAPPQPSWILAPFAYGGNSEFTFQGGEATTDQCARIQAHQKPQYALSILKSGWLWRKGFIGGWEKRYFVLHSGDKVRSAVLSNFQEVPTEQDNRRGTDIILWDALGLDKRDGPRFGFKHDEACFKLFHFYRDYRFCVPADDGFGKEMIDSERTEWMKLIQGSMVHAGAVKAIPFKDAYRCCCLGKNPEPKDCQLLNGLQLKKSKNLAKLGQPVCPSELGYKHYTKFKFNTLPEHCVEDNQS